MQFILWRRTLDKIRNNFHSVFAIFFTRTHFPWLFFLQKWLQFIEKERKRKRFYKISWDSGKEDNYSSNLVEGQERQKLFFLKKEKERKWMPNDLRESMPRKKIVLQLKWKGFETSTPFSWILAAPSLFSSSLFLFG